jgi:hypothetical protein
LKNDDGIEPFLPSQAMPVIRGKNEKASGLQTAPNLFESGDGIRQVLEHFGEIDDIELTGSE